MKGLKAHARKSKSRIAESLKKSKQKLKDKLKKSLVEKEKLQKALSKLKRKDKEKERQLQEAKEKSKSEPKPRPQSSAVTSHPKQDFSEKPPEPKPETPQQKILKRRLKKGAFYLILIFLIFSFLNFFLRLPVITRSINFLAAPINSNYFRTANIGKEYRDNILVVNADGKIRQIDLLSFDKREKELTIINVPLHYNVNLPGRGLVLLNDYQVTKENSEMFLLMMQDLLALPIDGVFMTSDSQSLVTEDLIQSLRTRSRYSIHKIPAMLGYLTRYVTSNMSTLDIAKVLGYLRSLREDKVYFYTLDNMSFELDVNGLKFETYDTVKIDGLIRKVMPETPILLEAASIEVRNATEMAGLANQMSRYLGNQGAQVVFKGNTTSFAKVSSVHVFEEKEEILGRLRFLHLKGKKASREGFNLETRGDILVIIGQDYIDTLYPRDK